MLKSIYSKVVVVLVMFVLTITMVSGIYFFLQERKQLLLELDQQSKIVSARLRANLKYPVWNISPQEIKEIIEFELTSKNVIAIVVRDDLGNVLAGYLKENQQDLLLIANHDPYEEAMSWDIYINRVDKIIFDNVHIGDVEVYFTDFFIRQELYNFALRTAFQYLIATLLIISIFYILLQQIVIKPIMKLNHAVNEFHIEEKKAYLPDVSKLNASQDEIGQLASRFQEMVKRLNDSFTTIQDKNDQLSLTLTEIDHLKNFLSSIINSMPSMIITLNDEDVITQWNQAARELTGIYSQEAMGKSIWEVLPAFKRYKKYLEEIKISGGQVELDKEHFLNDKTKYHKIAIYPLIGLSLNGLVIRIDDITEMTKIDNQLKQAQKMEMIGTLAGGLAHDFNNVLGGIVGTVSLMDFYLKQNKVDIEQFLNHVDIIKDSTIRATDMVKQLMTISRKNEIALAPLDLNMSIKHVVKICNNTFDKSIEILPIYQSQPAYINADITQIEQVLLNLCVNSSHAMTFMRGEDEKIGGKLELEITRIHADPVFCASHPEASEGDYWVVRISDTGIGMDANTLTKIFEPFFSTKEKGHGTGLGLAMVYSIIKQHQGFIDVYSELGTGTTFTLYLPLLEKVKIKVERKKEKRVKKKKEGLALVVDDDRAMQNITRNILQELGYKVIIATNGEEGVSVYQEKYQTIKFVILDMTMPKLSGKEAYLEMKKINPDVLVLLISGFKLDDRVQKVLSLGINGFLQKPFSLEQLENKLDEILESKQRN
ncbi:MAG: response regulator [Spirochaetes bacterium]|nr:response regulator [Spirochaetota bacterium]